MQGVPNGNEKRWTDESMEREMRAAIAIFGHYPSAGELRSIQRNDLCCAITKAGGLVAWAARLGFDRLPSDSDTGWRGERDMQALFLAQGLPCVRPPEVKCPYDLLVSDVLRVDVKSARVASYGRTGSYSAWHYRIGKHPQADLMALYQLDTGHFYGIPWWEVPTGNITIAAAGTGKYERFRDNWPLVRQMIGVRMVERVTHGGRVAEVA